MAPRFIASFKLSESTNLNAQVSKGFRLGGLNDPLNIPLCTADDLATFGGFDSFNDETAWNYEIGTKSRIFGGRGYVNASAFYIDINDLQAVVTAGSCSSRLVFSVPSARSIGGELEFGGVVSDHFDFNVSVGYNDATLRSTLTSTDAAGHVTIISGIREGARLPSVPDWQAAIAATYQQPVTDGVTGYLTGTWQYIGSRYTQVGDDVPGFGVVPLQNLPGALGAHDRRSSDPGHVRLRSAVAGVQHPQLPAGRAFQRIRPGVLRQQRDRRTGLPGARPGARIAGARRLPDQPAPDVRTDGSNTLLMRSRLCPPGKAPGGPLP